jgi:hypothetical protein
MHYKNEPEQENATNITMNDNAIRRNQAQVREVTQIMQQNIEKALNRDINLTILEGNSERLNESAQDFKVSSVKTKRKYWCKNAKWSVILACVILSIILIIVLGVGLGLGLNQNNNRNP